MPKVQDLGFSGFFAGYSQDGYVFQQNSPDKLILTKQQVTG